MRKFAYYNEIDSKAAAWIRELIKAKLITEGEVDERSIEDIVPNDLAGLARCHFFSGIAVWDYALNRAGYDRWDRVTWTGSCPCQPFSAAGKRAGLTDERHLWPAFYHLISQCRPDVVFGEQVASGDGLAWLDTVQDDMEAAGYTVGALDLCAAGFGAPHIRQRLYFVAESLGEQEFAAPEGRLHAESGSGSTIGELADATSSRRQQQPICRCSKGECCVHEPKEQRIESSALRAISTDLLCDAELHGLSTERQLERAQDEGRMLEPERSGATNGFWRDAEWLYCRDGKYRAVEPGVSPLAHGAAAKVGRLRGYGNAIVEPVAEAFIRAYLEIRA